MSYEINYGSCGLVTVMMYRFMGLPTLKKFLEVQSDVLDFKITENIGVQVLMAQKQRFCLKFVLQLAASEASAVVCATLLGPSTTFFPPGLQMLQYCAFLVTKSLDVFHMWRVL